MKKQEAEISSTCDPGVEAHEVVSVLLDAVDEVVFKVQATGIEALSTGSPL